MKTHSISIDPTTESYKKVRSVEYWTIKATVGNSKTQFI